MSLITCNNMEALAHRTALGIEVKPLENGRLEVIIIFVGEVFTRRVTSSIPSLSSIDQPSSLNPLTASLNPLRIYKKHFRF